MHDSLTRPSPTHAAQPARIPRVDLYAPIHKALRLFMNDTLQRIGAMDNADRVEQREALDQLGALLGQLRSHLHHENDFVHPALEARRPGSSGRVAGEHLEHMAAIEALEQEAALLADAPAELGEMLALRLYRHLALFIAENLQHMQIEESSHNRQLWADYRDDELIALHDALLASIAPEEMALTLRWMAPALSQAELCGLLGALRLQLPPEAFTGLLGQLRPHLTPQRWAKASRALGLSAD